MTLSNTRHSDDRVTRAFIHGATAAVMFRQRFGHDPSSTDLQMLMTNPASPARDLDRARLYFEAHITVRPPSTEEQYRSREGWDQFADTSRELGWRASKFEVDEVDDATGLWFLSTRHESYEHILAELQGMVHGLGWSDFEVVRYKIEDTLLDSKSGDEL